MKILRLFPLLFLLSDACVERLELPIVHYNSRIVVDGQLTNVFGTHSVKLFMAPPLESALTEGAPITNASVSIHDDEGNSFPLQHTSKGVYTIQDFQGQVGHRYKLQFSTAEGKHYESTLQELFSGGEITDLRYEFVENAINHNDLAAEHDVFRIYLDSKNKQSEPGLFRWRWTYTYEALTYPQLRKKPRLDTIPIVFIYDPMPCSGFIAVARGMAIAKMAECECCTCWVTDYSSNSMVSNNQLATRPEFENVQVAQVPVDWKKFQAKFYINVEQLNHSKEIYEFWKNVQAQQAGTASIFQPNVIRIRGNIKCVSDPSEEVAGIFSVAGSTQRAMFINRTDVPKILQPDTVINDCRKAYPGSTNVKPLFW